MDRQALSAAAGDRAARRGGLQISARQIDRRLQGQKTQRRRRLYGCTKPGYLLKHQIPVKTDSWDVKIPGFAEVDLVSHSGNSAIGEFVHTVDLTEMHSTWTESRAVLGRGEEAVQRAFNEIAGALPFPLRGQDFDRVFSIQHERVVNRDNTVALGRRVLQIDKTPWRGTLAGCRVTVYEQLDGTLSVGYGPQVVGRFNNEGIPLLAAVPKRQGKAVEKTGAARPWIRPRRTHLSTAATATSLR